jgi:hypothetical protein
VCRIVLGVDVISDASGAGALGHDGCRDLSNDQRTLRTAAAVELDTAHSWEADADYDRPDLDTSAPTAVKFRAILFC